MERDYLVSIKVSVDTEFKNHGIEQAKKTIEMLGLKVEDVKHIKDQRTLNQNSAMHKYFELIEQEAREKGLTMDMIIKKPQELPITRHLLKDLFRLIGKTMFKKKSTADLTKEEINEVISTFERIIAERLDITLPFPSIDNITQYSGE